MWNDLNVLGFELRVECVMFGAECLLAASGSIRGHRCNASGLRVVVTFGGNELLIDKFKENKGLIKEN